MKDFNEILQYHIDNNLVRVSSKQAATLSIEKKRQLQACLDLHNRLSSVRVKADFGHQALREALGELDDAPLPSRRFQWSTLKLGATVMASLVIVVVIGGFSWLSTSSKNNELSQDNVKPNGTVENLHNLNLADVESDTKTIQSDSGSNTAVNLSSTSNIDEAINENF